MTRVDREINQGRMTYVDLISDEKGLDTGTEAEGDETKPDKLPDAPGVDQLG